MNELYSLFPNKMENFLNPSKTPTNLMKVYHMTNKTRFKLFQCDYMIYIYSVPSQFILPFLLKPKYIIYPNETLTCVCAELTSLYI